MVTQDNLSPRADEEDHGGYEMADNLGGHEGVRKQFAGTRYNFADTYGVILIEKARRDHPAHLSGDR
jgi:hypothetical protein